MIKYNIIQDTKYFTLKECGKEIQNILEGKEQTIQKDKLMESINKALNNKKQFNSGMLLSIFTGCNTGKRRKRNKKIL